MYYSWGKTVVGKQVKCTICEVFLVLLGFFFPPAPSRPASSSFVLLGFFFPLSAPWERGLLKVFLHRCQQICFPFSLLFDYNRFVHVAALRWCALSFCEIGGCPTKCMYPYFKGGHTYLIFRGGHTYPYLRGPP